MALQVPAQQRQAALLAELQHTTGSEEVEARRTPPEGQMVEVLPTVASWQEGAEALPG